MATLEYELEGISYAIYGPYDITDYVTWQTDLTNGIVAGSKLNVVKKFGKVFFVEVRA